MDAFLALLREAHEEVMNATGWGALLSGAGQKWSMSPSGALQWFVKEVSAFLAAVDWWEPYFRWLALFHFAVAVIVIWTTWGASTERLLVFNVLLLFLVWCSSYLNEWGSSYAAHIFVEKGANYFDPSGLFITVTYAAPLLLLAIWLHVRVFVRLLRLMVVVKRKQIRLERRNHSSVPVGGKGAVTAAAKRSD